MIKRLFLGLFVGFVGLISFSNSEFVIRDNGNYGYSTIDNTIDLNVVNKGQLMSQRLGNTRRMLAFASSNDNRLYFWWATNQKPYYLINYPGRTAQGFLEYYQLCDGIVGSTMNNCTLHSITDNFVTEFGGFFDSITISDVWGYDIHTWNCKGNTFLINKVCFSSSGYNKTICFSAGSPGSSSCAGDDYGTLTGSLGFDYNIDFTAIPDVYINTPPGFTPSSTGGYTQGNGGILPETNNSALNYYETMYGWDQSICYVGVNNITSMYGSGGVSFQKGGGLSIFQVFSGLYGNTDIENMYVWLNTWLLNYEQWFNSDGNPRYLATYNSGTNQVDLYYDNLVFPFLNNPVALYFMTDNIETYSPYSTMGSSVISYCNMKINSGTFDEIIDQADKNNITNYTEKFNTNQGLNSDGSNKEYGAWLSSGVDIAFSGNTSIKNSLKNFFDTIDENINVSEGSSTLQILPTWLLSALMFVILFKFLRKR